MTARCVDCDRRLSALQAARCRHCNGRLMRQRHRRVRAARASGLSICAKRARLVAEKLEDARCR